MGRRRRSGHPAASGRQPKPPDPFVHCRAFVGYRVPTSVSNALLEVQRRMDRQRHEGARFRWVSALELHVNLRHVGRVLPESLEHATTVLHELANEQPSFPVRAAELRLWPEEGPPAALWATLAGQGDRLAALREALDARLADSGFPLPAHPFVPHITLALVDELPDPEDFLQHARAARGQGLGRFWLSELQLFVQPEGETTACYEQVARASLQRPPARHEQPLGEPARPVEPDVAPTQAKGETRTNHDPSPGQPTPDEDSRRERTAE